MAKTIKLLPIAALLITTPLYAQSPLTTAPPSGPAPKPYILRQKDPILTEAQKLTLLRRHIKYVFVLFQENRSFDFYFGSYPGVPCAPPVPAPPAADPETPPPAKAPPPPRSTEAYAG